MMGSFMLRFFFTIDALVLIVLKTIYFLSCEKQCIFVLFLLAV